MSEEELNCFNEAITSDEIRITIFAIGSFKAQGIDRLHAIFYKSMWETMGGDMCALVKDVFVNPNIIEAINETIIALMPKQTMLLASSISSQ